MQLYCGTLKETGVKVKKVISLSVMYTMGYFIVVDQIHDVRIPVDLDAVTYR